MNQDTLKQLAEAATQKFYGLHPDIIKWVVYGRITLVILFYQMSYTSHTNN